jgi:hypothetical protein
MAKNIAKRTDSEGGSMPEMIDVGEVRKRAVRLLRFKDGLWDILLGSVFLLMSVYPLTRELLGPTWNALAFGLVLIVLLLGAAWARVALVIPRRGVAKPRPSTTRTITLVFRVTLVLALLTVVLWTLFATSVLPRPPWGKAPGWVHTLAPDILVATLFVLIFSVVARSAGVGRVYLYGWLLGFGTLASTALERHAGITFHFPLAIAAGIIVIVGIGVLIRFLREFSIPKAEV